MFQKFVVAAVIALAGIYLLSPSPAQTQDATTKHPKTWRHLALNDGGLNNGELARQINQLGDDGWELVDVESFASEGAKVKTVYYFKKPGDA